MRIIGLLILIFFSTKTFGQLDSLGLGDNTTLNKQEETFLNSDFTDKRGDFDLNGKKIAYVGGTRGNILFTKKEFFDDYVRPRIGTNKKRNYSLIILTTIEKEKSGGYDAFILTPPKMFTDRDRERLITELSKR